MEKLNEYAGEARRKYRIRVLCREFADAVMRRDYATADRCWVQLDNLQLARKKRIVPTIR